MSDLMDAAPDILKVIDGLELPDGQVNTDDETLRAHIASAMRRHIPQVRRQALQGDRICLLGGGPSLNDTLPELKELIYQGAKLVTVNGAYHWALDHNLEPKSQIVMDARPSNARFVDPALPRCNYLLSSTCHPDLWDKVEDRERVWIWHPVQRTDPAAAVLDEHYLKTWEWIGGGTTVITRALFVLRMLGYVRFDLFGVDSCFLHNRHHAYPQAENDGDRTYKVTVGPTGYPALAKEFVCAGWHLKQVEDVLRILRVNGEHFLLNVHGDGMLSHLMRTQAHVYDIERAA